MKTNVAPSFVLLLGRKLAFLRLLIDKSGYTIKKSWHIVETNAVYVCVTAITNAFFFIASEESQFALISYLYIFTFFKFYYFALVVFCRLHHYLLWIRSIQLCTLSFFHSILCTVFKRKNYFHQVS